MAVHTISRKSPRPWATVVSVSHRKTFRFEIMSVDAEGREVRIRNTDGTVTLLIGHGLATTGRRGEGETVQASLAGGTITALRRLADDGSELEALTDVEVLAGGPSSQLSFARPPGEMSSLDWVIGGAAPMTPPADRHEEPETGAQPGQPAPQSAESLEIAVAATPGIGAAGLGQTPAAARRHNLAPLVTIAASMVVGFGTVLIAWRATDTTELDRDKARFARPASIPAPADNVPTQSRIVLGRRLFTEPRLSADGLVSCATCHDPDRAFADGRQLSVGVSGRPLKRHSPTLWNVAWGRAFFWDGRSPSLEAQARGPIEDPEEMGLGIEDALGRLRADPSYVAAFAAAYPESPAITADTLTKALATYQRSLVAPPTRFDRWIAGDRSALSALEIGGFKVFIGKANCASCHSGWAFTDHGFHDIGLPGADQGRGRILGLPHLDHAFKTPSLRELRWTAPYMHDGSLGTLDDVVRHYEQGVIDRPSLSRDLPRRLELTPEERAGLIAFLATLSSEATPKPLASIEIARSRSTIAGSQVSQLKSVGQKDKRFAPEHVRIGLGETLVIVNNDSRPHNVSIAHPRMGFSSGMQEPGEEIRVAFPEAGQYDIFCGVHPNMRLLVEVLTAAERGR